MSDLRVIVGKADPAPKPEKAADLTHTRVIPPSVAASITASHTPISVEPGSTLGSYLIISKIGEGGMGMVYKAHDTTLDRTVALKVLSPHLFRNQEFLNRFRIEAQAQARLNGPNIVTLHSMFEIPGSLVLVMEYVEGQTLEQRLHNEGRLSVASTVWVFEQALLGVERAHRMGIVHRDLKPSNIFITSTHEVKLMDFGVAKILDNKANTQSGSMIGTLMYISPEQIKGHDADFRSDIYTLGITLYQAVTGVLPFEKKTDYEYMTAHLHEQPLPPTALQPAMPQELEDIILKAIEKEPDQRFQNAHEFRKALLKVGMVHVRAYRRLKALRKEKDKAAFGGGPQSYRRDEDTVDSPGLMERVREGFEQFTENKRRLAAGIAAIAALGVAGTLMLRPAPPVPVAQIAPEPTPVAAPAESPVATSQTAPASTTESPAQAAGLPPAVTPHTDTTAAAKPDVTEPVKQVSAPKPRPAVRKEARNEPKKSDEKYDALKKAWGG
jgi:serine/threonine-protein kinase